MRRAAMIACINRLERATLARGIVMLPSAERFALGGWT
jgi:hypothetical protein